MDGLDNLLLKLKVHIGTHPNLMNMWIKYVEIKKTKLESLIGQGEKMLNNIDNIEDFPLETIPFIFMLLSQEMNLSN
jgi:mannose-6-phosphate isomerase class I